MRSEVIEIVRERPKTKASGEHKETVEEKGARIRDPGISDADVAEVKEKVESEADAGDTPKLAEPISVAPNANAIAPEEEDDKPEVVAHAVYEHPYVVRLCHWVNVVALFVMVGSGLQIFRAFPSFGAKIPQKDLLHWPKAFAIGGWLGGALQWHLTFMWIYLATGIIYLTYQILSGNYRQVLFTHRDIRGVWPMVKHYFFFGPKPPAREAYNPLQKQAYTTAIILGVLSVLTGFAVWKPVQFSWLGWFIGGFHYARIWHFAVMWAILFFVLGHLVMVILHGWNNFVSMITGWKKNPDY